MLEVTVYLNASGPSWWQKQVFSSMIIIDIHSTVLCRHSICGTNTATITSWFQYEAHQRPVQASVQDAVYGLLHSSHPCRFTLRQESNVVSDREIVAKYAFVVSLVQA